MRRRDLLRHMAGLLCCAVPAGLLTDRSIIRAGSRVGKSIGYNWSQASEWVKIAAHPIDSAEVQVWLDGEPYGTMDTIQLEDGTWVWAPTPLRRVQPEAG